MAPCQDLLDRARSRCCGALDMDANEDGRYSAGEPFVGAEPPVGYLYAPKSLPAERTPTSGALPAGLHKVLLPQACGYKPPPATTSGDCGVPLGERCNADADCSPAGVCLKETKVSWRGGYCAIPEPPRDGCRPGAARYLRAPRYGMTPPFVSGWYLRPCETSSDCMRAKGPGQDLYACDVGLRACTPTSPGFPLVPVGGSLLLEPFCAPSL